MDRYAHHLKMSNSRLFLQNLQAAAAAAYFLNQAKELKETNKKTQFKYL